MLEESSEMLRRAMALLEAHEEQTTAVDTSTNTERIERLLFEINGRSLSVSEIAKTLDIQPGSVRVALYANKERFTQERINARRVRWRLGAHAEEEVCT